MGSLGRVLGPFGSENLYLRFGPDWPHAAAAALEAGALVLSGAALLRENTRAAASPDAEKKT
jgi:hypothetical protein